MSPVSAAALLQTSNLVNKTTFAAKRRELTDAAPKVCTLLNVANKALSPTRTITSLNPEGEVCLLFQYDVATNPDSVRADFLATLSSGYFIGVTDRRCTPPKHGVMFRSRDSYSFSASAAEEVKQPPPVAAFASASAASNSPPPTPIASTSLSAPIPKPTLAPSPTLPSRP